MTGRSDLVRISAPAVRAVDPAALVRKALWRSGSWRGLQHVGRELARWQGPAVVVGAGKAAVRMAAGCAASLGAGEARGFVITADGCGVPLRGIEYVEAGHPTPDERGLRATARLLTILSDAAH